MYLQDLKRINALDSKIANLHKDLANLYAERMQLTAATAHTVPTQSPINETATQTLYTQLAESWAQYDIKLPTYKSFSKKLEKAQSALRALPRYKQPVIVAVPPFAKLQHALEAAQIAPENFSDSELLQGVKKNAGWTVVIVDAGRAVAVETSTITNKGAYATDLGVQEFMASQLQGVTVSWTDLWTLLLKDAADIHSVPCVTAQNDQLVFDTDDTTCLLGRNCIIPAVKVA